MSKRFQPGEGLPYYFANVRSSSSVSSVWLTWKKCVSIGPFVCTSLAIIFPLLHSVCNKSFLVARKYLFFNKFYSYTLLYAPSIKLHYKKLYLLVNSMDIRLEEKYLYFKIWHYGFRCWTKCSAIWSERVGFQELFCYTWRSKIKFGTFYISFV